MRVLITGGQGQLGEALVRRASEAFGAGAEVLAAGRDRFDVTRPEVVGAIAALGPDIVINAAAMTNVDGCEDDPDGAQAVNGRGAGWVAEGARRANAALVHVSTDFVFSGTLGRPYCEDDTPDPVSVYGASKLAGERAVKASGARAYIVRTAWLYGLAGHNFVTKIVSRAAQQSELQIVTGEVGNPTFCDDLAEAIGHLVRTQAYGTYHLTNAGYCSRFEFARAILDLAGRPDYPLVAVDSFPRKATPPSFAPLANHRASALGIVLRPWREGLASYFRRGRRLEERDGARSPAAASTPGLRGAVEPAER